MSIAEFAVTKFATLFVAIGPVDTALVFGGLTGGVHRPDRLRLALQAVLIAGGVLFGFALFGVQLLDSLHVSLGGQTSVFQLPNSTATSATSAWGRKCRSKNGNILSDGRRMPVDFGRVSAKTSLQRMPSREKPAIGGLFRTEEGNSLKSELIGWRRSPIRTILRKNSQQTGNSTGKIPQTDGCWHSWCSKILFLRLFPPKFPEKSNRENLPDQGCRFDTSGRGGIGGRPFTAKVYIDDFAMF